MNSDSAVTLTLGEAQGGETVPGSQLQPDPGAKLQIERKISV